MNNLDKLRQELKVPKNQYNSFGKYSYRSQEDILEAVKPLLIKYDLSIIISDELVQIGERYYIKATVKLITEGETITTTAYAREPEHKKGMDESQITGTASSYARKYALNAMFLIDDVKDADTDNYQHVQKQPEKKPEKPFDPKLAEKKIDELMQKLAFPMEYREQIHDQFKKAKTKADYTAIYKAVELEGETL